MGALDQLAKQIFAEETSLVTQGGALWVPPVEIGLSEVRLDGLLRLRDPARLASLGPPWSELRGHDEAVLELKMQRDHLGALMLQRSLLRRQARNVQRLENIDDPWDGETPLWLVASHVPEMLSARRTLRLSAPGCYLVGPSSFQFLWIAANELPLRDDLIPFLVARTGRAFAEFVRWVCTRRSTEWVTRMIQIVPMPAFTREEALKYFPRTDDPELTARQHNIIKVLLATFPEVNQEVLEEGRVEEARRALRRVLSLRGLPVSAQDEARIDACSNLETLERWHGAAVVASTAAEALR